MREQINEAVQRVVTPDERALEKIRGQGKLTARERIDLLLDAGLALSEDLWNDAAQEFDWADGMTRYVIHQISQVHTDALCRRIGIDPERLPQIFGRFERAVSERHYGGLGLGLYITRQIVEAHGGSIRAESTPGVRTVFTVELPLSPPPSPGRGAQEAR